MNQDIKALRGAVRALQGSSPAMRRATLIYLWDRFVLHPPKEEGESTLVTALAVRGEEL